MKTQITRITIANEQSLIDQVVSTSPSPDLNEQTSIEDFNFRYTPNLNKGPLKIKI